MNKLLLVLVLLFAGCSASESFTPLEKQISEKFQEASDDDVKGIRVLFEMGAMMKRKNERLSLDILNKARLKAVEIVGPGVKSGGAKFIPAVKKVVKLEMRKRGLKMKP